MDGVLVVDKPSGPTSHDVVARVRRAIRTRRIGHTGTLDPLATGVLPLVIGRATRLASFFSSGEKSYEADVRLGAATESYDAAERLRAGIPPPPAPAVSETDIDAALAQFRGSYLQAPPPYSAKKIGGIASHRLARRNKPAQPAPVRVTVVELGLLSLEHGVARLRVTASAGFYVRTLAHELGKVLGCGAHIESLRRIRAGPFGLDDAVQLDVLEREPEQAASRIVPLERLLPDLPSITLNEAGARRAGHGNDIRVQDMAVNGGGSVLTAAETVRLFDSSGRLLGLAHQAAGGVLRPTVVLV